MDRWQDNPESHVSTKRYYRRLRIAGVTIFDRYSYLQGNVIVSTIDGVIHTSCKDVCRIELGCRHWATGERVRDEICICSSMAGAQSTGTRSCNTEWMKQAQESDSDNNGSLGGFCHV